MAMSKPISKTLIGGFVLGALALAVAGLVVLGSGRFFSKMDQAILYFDGSVKGLSIGAPVMFRGVKIGSVTDIGIKFNPASLEFQIPVIVEFTTKRAAPNASGARTPAETHKLLIEKGFRARLEMQSFVTGQLMIALEFYPDQPARFLGDGSILEIPTIPTSMEHLAKKLENIPFEKLVNSINSAAAGMDRMLNSPELTESIVNLNQSLKALQGMLVELKAEIGPIGSAVEDAVKDAQKLFRNVDGQVASLGASLEEAVGDTRSLLRRADGQVASLGTSLEETLGNTRKLVRSIDGRVDPLFEGIQNVIGHAESAMKQTESALANLESSTAGDSVMMIHLMDTLNEYAKAARAIRALAEYLEKNPEALLRGKGQQGEK